MARLNLNVRRGRGMTGIGGGITGRIGGCLGPVVCTVSARMSGVEFSVGLAAVSINTSQRESLRATCTTLAVGQRQWGTMNPPDAPGLVVAGSGWVLSVPRLFLCVGALHPIRRQCTSSVRVHRHVTGAPPPCLWRLSGLWGSSDLGLSSMALMAEWGYGVVGVFWAWAVFRLGCLLGFSCLPLGVFEAPHVVVPQKCRT